MAAWGWGWCVGVAGSFAAVGWDDGAFDGRADAVDVSGFDLGFAAGGAAECVGASGVEGAFGFLGGGEWCGVDGGLDGGLVVVESCQRPLPAVDTDGEMGGAEAAGFGEQVLA